ncbi:TPA: hypothetical protein N0F65_009308 [Lagenidium giganteum]|uniref:Fibronectin type-III domain-containing protein n=1 Tax=Lagenidium giganteum TaxID=4803 RepID=A0AAV2YVL1_9STRA|nr:TPA: hypothetical protein N0F65_009308 [Lagenidium giganteum]
MGNVESGATSSDVQRVCALRDELASLEHAIEHLVQRPVVHPLLPHQLSLDGAVVSTVAHVRVLVGPVVGKVTPTTARVLLEVDHEVAVTCHVSMFDGVAQVMVELKHCRVQMQCPRGRPTCFVLTGLVPGRQYKLTFSGLCKSDATSCRGSFSTPSFEVATTALNAVVVSGNNVYELERGEPSLLQDVQELVERNEVQLVLHLGGQVALQRMFDQAAAVLVRHVTSTIAAQPSREWIEAKATEVLRSAYRTQWTLTPAIRSILANASNLMIWSDQDMYPAFTTAKQFEIDHEQPTMQMQVLRAVLRCARRLFHEYQRQLWDDELAQLHEKEDAVIKIAEKALETTAKIYQLGVQIPIIEAEVELMKKRRDADGARRVEKQLRSVESEKIKLEKQVASYNQVLAPQRGEEFVHILGPIAILVLDQRSSRLDPGGCQASHHPMLSNAQWSFIEQVLDDDSVKLLFVCSELPVVDNLVTELSMANETVEGGLAMKSWWGSNEDIQSRLLSLVFTWRMQQPNRDFILLSGASGTKFSMSSTVRDLKLRSQVVQHVVGPVTGAVHGLFVPRKNGLLHARFEFDHLTFVTDNKSFAKLQACVTVDKEPVVEVIHVRSSSHQSTQPRLLLGPIVGFVDASSAVVMLEVDQEADLVCAVSCPLTGATQKFFQHFQPRQPNSFFLTNLQPEMHYQARFLNVQRSDEYEASWTTIPPFPRRLDLLALCHTTNNVFENGEFRGSDMWKAIAQATSNVPFSRINLTLHLGGHADVRDSPFLQEAVFLYYSDRADAEEQATQKIRDMYRLTWNMPGVRESLAHNAHLMFWNVQDEVPELCSSNEAELWLAQRLRDVHHEYHNMLLPPAKRSKSATESWSNPLWHAFGEFGVFFLPVRDFGGTCIHPSVWNVLDRFLKTPAMTQVILITTEPVLEDSLEDTIEKARLQAEYRWRFSFHQHDLQQLLSRLFDWKTQEASGGITRKVVLLSGSRMHGFDSIIEEHKTTIMGATVDEESNASDPSAPADSSDGVVVKKASQIIQCVAGPFVKAPSSTSPSLEKSVLPAGSLFGKYSYRHAFTCVKPLKDEAAATEQVDLNGNDASKSPAQNISASESQREVGLVSQFLHFSLVQTPETTTETNDTAVANLLKCIVVASAPLEFTQDLGQDCISTVTVDASNPWIVEPAPPAWLARVLTEPLSTEESDIRKELASLLESRDQEIRQSFDLVYDLKEGLVGLSDKPRCVLSMAEGLQIFHTTLSGVAFRQRFSLPSLYVISFTIDQRIAAAARFQANPDTADYVPPIAGALEIIGYIDLCRLCYENSCLLTARLKRYLI